MSTSANQPAEGQLGLWDAVSIIVGIVIGTTIFELPWLIFANTPKYNELPAEYKAALLAGAHAGNTHMMAKYDAQNPGALRKLAAAGTQLRPFPRPVMDACYNAAMELYAETSAKNAAFKKIYDSMLAFQKEQILWFRVTENTYDNYMATAGQQPAGKGAAPAKKS